MDCEMRRNRPMTVPGTLMLTVGQASGDLQGSDDRVLQAGVDYLHRLGGGILQILPGVYAMRNALYVPSGIAVRGAGEDTVLKKTPGVCTPLVRDSDWYEARIAVANAAGFAPGCGVMLRGYDGKRLSNVVRATVTAVEGNVLALDKRMLKNFWVGEQATAATLFPIVTAEAGTCDVRLENLVLDGNKAENEEINGNYAGAVFIQECDRFSFSRVTARNYNGDGFSFQVCDDVRFDHCQALDNANLGFHPGSGSQRPVFKNCTATGNSQGIFFCWGVSYGLADGCVCSENRDYGISIGHRDTDNRIVNTRIERNEKVGVLFRQPVTDFRGAHRNVVERCQIVDNGFKAEGLGVEIRGLTCDIALRDNRVADSGKGLQRVGIKVSAEAEDVVIEGNCFEGLREEVVREAGGGG